MRHRVVRFFALPPHDCRLLLQAAAVQPALRIALRIAGFRRCHLALRRLTRLRVRSEVGVIPIRADQLLRAGERLGLLDGNCLVHSLTLWWLLRRRGIHSDIRIGVRRTGDRLEAHAWVELAGQVLGDDGEAGRRFVPLASTSDIIGSGALAAS